MKKAELIELFVAYLFAFITPLAPMLLLIGCLLLSDVFTAMWRDKLAKKPLHSKAMGKTVTKMILYMIAVLLAHGMETVFGLLPFVSITGGYVCLVEFKSNLENISEATGIDLWNAIKNKIDSLRDQ